MIINKHHLDIKDKFIEYEADMKSQLQVNIKKAALH